MKDPLAPPTLEGALRATMRADAARDVPHGLLSRVLDIPASSRERRRRRPVIRSYAAAIAGGAAVIAVLLAAVAVARWGPFGATNVGAGPRNPVSWTTPYVSLSADDFRIDAGDRQFVGLGTRMVAHSDPGDATYRSLELGWPEAGVEMRLYLYFAADAKDWWVTEIRTYDGLPNTTGSNWIYYRGDFFRTPLGGTFEGDVNLTSTASDNDVTGHLSISGMRLKAFAVGASDAPRRSAAAPGQIGSSPVPCPSGATCVSVGDLASASAKPGGTPAPGITLYVRNGTSQDGWFAIVPLGEAVADHAMGSVGFNPNDMGVACIDPSLGRRLVQLDRNPKKQGAAVVRVIDDGEGTDVRPILWVDIGAAGTTTKGDGVPDWWPPPPQAC